MFDIPTKSLILKYLSFYENKSNIRYKEFFHLWKSFIDSWANDNMFFADLKNKDKKGEVFCYSFTTETSDFNLHFNIDRILKFIKQNNIKSYLYPSKILENKFIYSKEEISTTITPKSINPILIYFPQKDGNITEYLAIDGNHRISKYILDGVEFDLLIIKPFDLRMGCFCNLNSWILYQFYVNCYNLLNADPKYITQLINKNKIMLREAENFFQGQ